MMDAPTTLIVHADPQAFVQAVRVWLEKNEAENGLLLGNLDLLPKTLTGPVPFLAEAKGPRGTELVGCYRERYLLLSRGPLAAVDDLAHELAAYRVDVPGVVGPSEAADRFAETWASVRRCGSRLEMDQGLYRLNQVRPPEGIAGRMRVAGPRDRDLIAEWLVGFRSESMPHESVTLEAARREAEARAQSGSTFVWEAEGAPVSMAALARPTRRGITVNMVYTPPSRRRKGYAMALAAAVSQEGLRRGKEFCVLYTDLANPTSNSIYQRIGYEQVGTSRLHAFRYFR